MKKLIALVMVSTLGLVSCSKDQAAPNEKKEGSGAKAPAPKTETTALNLDGVWKTKCLGGSVQTKYQPYVAEVTVQGGEFFQKWTSYSDADCQTVESENYTTTFDYVIGAEVSAGVKALDISWDKTVTEADGKGHRYQGKLHNILSLGDKTLKYAPLYEVAVDELDGLTPEKRLTSFLNPSTQIEEEYTRE